MDVENIKEGQTLRLDQLFFSADSSEIKMESFAVLDEVYEFLNSNQNIYVEIGGHTNNIPSHEYCDKLSTDRARAVAGYITDSGILNERISYKGYGKRNPIASNRTRSGRSKNQRVEIKILRIE